MNISYGSLINPVTEGDLFNKNLEVDEEEIYKDMMYMKRMYPNIAKEINELIEDECDKLEYDGSIMFHEYPDKVMVDKMVSDIYEKYKAGVEEIQKQECINCNRPAPAPAPPPPKPPRPVPPPPPPKPPMDNCPMCDLINTMLCNEMYCRRRRHNRKSKMF